MYEEVAKIIQPLYLVGGATRDELLGREPKDFDFCTPLLPDDIEARVIDAGRSPKLIGKKFGTIAFKIKGPSGVYEFVEVTTFRSEVYTPGGRKPQVEFVNDITADLSRRDYTFNAIAKRDGRFIDPFGGRLDIMERIIRCVGRPKDRFSEDPLRMLRAARFAAQLGFEVEQLTEATTKKLAYKILHVSKERWVMEMDKLLMTERPSVGLDFLARTRLLNYMIPELATQVGYDQDSPYHELTLWEHTLSTVDLTEPNLEWRWAALLHDVGKPYVATLNNKGYHNYIHHDLVGAEIANKIGSYLKWSNDRRETVSKMIFEHLQDSSPIRKADNGSKTRLP